MAVFDALKGGFCSVVYFKFKDKNPFWSNDETVNSTNWRMHFAPNVRANHRENQVDDCVKKLLLVLDIILVGNGLN